MRIRGSRLLNTIETFGLSHLLLAPRRDLRADRDRLPLPCATQRIVPLRIFCTRMQNVPVAR
eukprot:SAG11_NODE_33449_length_277_cov_0.775281_1_plen_61_part_01